MDVIKHVFYPVFPPDEHADEVLTWLRSRSTQGPAKDKIPSLRLSIEPIGGERLDRFVGIAGQDELSEVCSDTRCQRDP